jgi:tetraacyldisaccharide 4'-kinase
VLADLFAAAVRRRRERYAARPDLRRRLRRPVISIGNLAVGGRGKTPTVAATARLLLELGERPAILSRGYGRALRDDGVVVVSDPGGIRADLDRSGDEPLMLARQLPGVAVLAGEDRYLAGRLAEHHLGATVHVLDDGFQHLQLDRDADIVLVGRDDVRTPITLPAGRLREPVDALVAADAIIAADPDVSVDGLAADVPVFGARRVAGVVRAIAPGTPVFAFAGIAGPSRFFDELGASGWEVRGTRAFRDHQRYDASHVTRLAAAAAAAGAAALVTTEKDYVRLLPLRPFPIPVGWVPLTMEPDPLPEFRRWLAGTLDRARDIIRD